MEKKLIRVDRFANIGISHKGNMKIKLFNDALEYCGQFITIEESEKLEFSRNFVVFLESKLRDKSNSFIPSEWNRSRLFDFYQVSESILNEIQHRFMQLRQIQLSEDFKTAILPDNRIFAETPEQLERRRASRRKCYYNHKEQFNTYVKQRYNSDPVCWEKKLNQSKKRYRTLRENVLKKEARRET